MLSGPVLKTADIIPVSPHFAQFADWMRSATHPEAPRTQHPVDELLGEHYVMDAALAALEREIRRLSVHGQLRPPYWEDVVDFFGNFVHQVHRRKEEQGLFPALLEALGDPDRSRIAEIAREHERAKDFTILIADGVSEGDWEKVLRAAHMFLSLGRDHMPREEKDAFLLAKRVLSEDAVAELRARFDELERFGLGDRGRLYYVRLAESLCERAGIEGRLPNR